MIETTRRRGALALLAASGLLAPAMAPAVEPFYLDRLDEGIAAMESGDAAEAATSLRVACFGMLDEPPLLGGCLVRLALAQAVAGDEAAFAETVHRILDGEERVGLYRQAELSPEMRAEFEARILGRLPRERLRAIPTFAGVLSSWEEQQVEALAPRFRRRRLGELLAEQPKDPRWPRLLARLEMSEGDARATIEASSIALALDPGDDAARCLQGWGQAQLGRCDEAVPLLAACALGAGQAFSVELLSCRVQRQEWAAAADLIAEMPSEWTRGEEGRRLVEEVRRRAPEGP